MSDPTQDAHDDHHEEHSHTALFLMVFVGLCCLTTLSFLTYFDFWRQNVPVNVSRAFMMAVSCTKAMLVIMFFMHLKWEANWKWVLTAPVVFMSALLVFALVPDVGLRMRHASHERMIYAAELPAADAHTHNEGDHSEGDHSQNSHDDDAEGHQQEAQQQRTAA
ncbi:MAG: cytochrome C oxidase subunit IV family protein [Bythopirellula sp.]